MTEQTFGGDQRSPEVPQRNGEEFVMAEYAQTERAFNATEEGGMDDSRSSHVSSALAEGDEGAQHLLEAIRELERRLSDVLRPQVDGPDKAMGTPREALVPLAERLTAQNGMVRMARQYVASIIGRLEL